MITSQKPEVRSQKSKAWGLGHRAWGMGFGAWGLLMVVMAFLFSCAPPNSKPGTTEKSDESGVAKFVFSEEIHNFGSVKAGEIVVFSFVFKNEGTKTLTITGVDSGCGCTEVNIPSKSVAPGKEGIIEVMYNSAGEVGNQLKTITIFSNAETPRKEIYIRANVSNEIIELYS